MMIIIIDGEFVNGNDDDDDDDTSIDGIKLLLY